MKKYWCILVFFTISLIHFQTLFSQSLFNPDGLTLIEITFENSNWDQQLDAFYAADLNERLLATIEINGKVLIVLESDIEGGAPTMQIREKILLISN